MYEVEKVETAFTNEMAQVLRITLKRLRVMCKTCLSKLSICPSIILWKKLKSAVLFFLSLSIILCQGLAWKVSFLIDLTHYQMGMGIDSSVPFCTQVSKTYVHGSYCYGQSVVSAEVQLQNSTRAHILFNPLMILQFHCH